MNRILNLFASASERIAPLLALGGLLISLWLLASAQDAAHVFWALCALALSAVAVWAFFGEIDE